MAVATAVSSLALALPGPAAAAAAAPSAVSASDVALLEVGGAASVLLHGKVHRLGDLGQVMDVVDATPSGELVIGGNELKLITPTGLVKVLAGGATVDGFAVSPNGRYVAWTVERGGARAQQPYQLSLYDLQRHALVHSHLLDAQGRPVGFLADGRVAVQGEQQSYLWTPTSGTLAKVGAAHLPSVDQASGHLLVLSPGTDECSVMIKDARTGKSVLIPNDGRQCQFLEALSPDGSRWFAAVLSAVDEQLVSAPGIAAAGTGKSDPRLSQLFYRQRMSMTDGTWIDSRHLLVIAQRYQPRAKVGRQLEELCTIPVTAAPTCSTLRDLGPYERPAEDTNDPTIGPDVWLAHPLGQ